MQYLRKVYSFPEREKEKLVEGVTVYSCCNVWMSRSLSSAVPSAPLSVISSINETSVSLEWAEPRDSGGRADLVYNVVCKKCEHGACVRCDDNVEVAPRRLGLAERHAAVRNLQAHTHYSFEIQAVNGVSPKSPITPRYATVNITTNQAGEKIQIQGKKV